MWQIGGVYNASAMRKLKVLVGAAVAVGAVTVDGLVWWSVLDPALNALRSKGPAGQLIASLVGSHVVMLGLALAALVYAVRAFYGDPTGLPPKAEMPPIHIENKPVFVNNNNPQQVQHNQQIQKQRVPQREEREQVASLQFVQAECPRIAEAGFLNAWTNVQESPHAGLVAVFRNVPRGVGQRTPSATRVTAHLIFRNPANADEQELNVNFGTWLSEYTHFKSFGAGQAHRLLIFIEVMGQLDARRVRGIALTATQGLARGMTVEDTGAPLRGGTQKINVMK